MRYIGPVNQGSQRRERPRFLMRRVICLFKTLLRGTSNAYDICCYSRDRFHTTSLMLQDSLVCSETESPSKQAEVWLGAALRPASCMMKEAERLIALATLTTHQERRNARIVVILRLCNVKCRKGPNSCSSQQFVKVAVAPGWNGGFSRIRPAVQVSAHATFCLTVPLHSHSCFTHVIVWGLSAGDFSHVMVLYLKELNVSEQTAN